MFFLSNINFFEGRRKKHVSKGTSDDILTIGMKYMFVKTVKYEYFCGFIVNLKF